MKASRDRTKKGQQQPGDATAEGAAGEPDSALPEDAELSGPGQFPKAHNSKRFRPCNFSFNIFKFKM
jgi:hypothetical protein